MIDKDRNRLVFRWRIDPNLSEFCGRKRLICKEKFTYLNIRNLFNYINFKKIRFLGIINFYNLYFSFAAVFFGFNTAFAADIINFVAYRSKFIHTVMNTKNCSGRETEVENRK